MGTRVSWIAARGLGAESLLSALRLRGTGETSDEPGERVQCANGDEGWFFVWANEAGFFDAAPLEALSEGGEIAFCMLDETVMISSAAHYRAGERVWSADCDDDGHVEIEGELPPDLQAIRNELLERQVEADEEDEDVSYVFSVPPDLVRELTGFDYEDARLEWEILTRVT